MLIMRTNLRMSEVIQNITILVCMLTAICFSSSSSEDTASVDSKPEKITRLVKFRHQSCSELNPEDFLLQIEDFRLTTNMTSRKPSVLFNFIGELISDLEAPIELDVHMSMLIGNIWVPVPCVRGVGTCNYRDLCRLTSELSCPQQAVDRGYSCSCPVKRGKLSVSDMSVDFPSPDKSGTYIMVANVTRENDVVFCQEMMAKFKTFTLNDDDDDNDDEDT